MYLFVQQERDNLGGTYDIILLTATLHRVLDSGINCSVQSPSPSFLGCQILFILRLRRRGLLPGCTPLAIRAGFSWPAFATDFLVSIGVVTTRSLSGSPAFFWLLGGFGVGPLSLCCLEGLGNVFINLDRLVFPRDVIVELLFVDFG